MGEVFDFSSICSPPMAPLLAKPNLHLVLKHLVPAWRMLCPFTGSESCYNPALVGAILEGMAWRRGRIPAPPPPRKSTQLVPALPLVQVSLGQRNARTLPGGELYRAGKKREKNTMGEVLGRKRQAKKSPEALSGPGQFQMLIADHCTIFLWELGFLPQRQQEQSPICEKCQGLLGAAKAQHVDPANRRALWWWKEALGVGWKNNWRPLREVTQPTEQCEMPLVIPPHKKLYSCLSPEPMPFFLTRQRDVIDVKSCLPLAEENEVNAEGNEANVAAARLCWRPWISKKSHPWRAASLPGGP